MARSTWTGAITFAGFPINVKAYSLTKSRSSDSFKTLCPCHGKPIKAPRVCATDGTEIPLADQIKGVEIGKDTYAVLPKEAIESIESATRSVSVEPKFFPSYTVPAYLATNSYAIVPDDKVPGADKPVAILHEALLANGLTLVVEDWVARAGSRDAILAITAHPDGLIAHTIPHDAELVKDIPRNPLPAVEEAERDMFTQVIQTNYTPQPFEHDKVVSNYKERRDTAVQAVLAGEPVQAAQAEKATAVPDMMAALKASLANAGVAS